MAKIPSTLVLKFWPMITRFLSSSWTPAASRPTFSVFGLLPTETSATSQSNTSSLPFFSRVRVTPSSRTSAAFTLVSSLKLNLRVFLRQRWKAVISSLSIVGQILSMNSITVTSAPRRPHTDPNSNPITPPPIMAIFLGTLGKSRAPVEDTQVLAPSSLNFMKGSSTGSDPVAMMVFLVLMMVFAPSAPVASIVFLSRNFPQPCT
mmetsp:Transcript_13194/g.20705  ORF Transcript_13194/g.20705 Transcript_13194/m.20705 type:complete len:205 (+) Transcript_13194:530-1144(+)